MTTTRRSFLQLLGGTAVATAVAPAIPEAKPILAGVDPELIAPRPSGLTALHKSAKLLISWDPVEDAKYYEVIIGDHSLKKQVSAFVNSTKFILEDGERGVTQEISVRAVTAEGNRSASQSVWTTVPGKSE